MIASYLLALREGLEAALIVGVVFGALGKMRRGDLRGVVWAGVLAAVAVSAAAGLAFATVGATLEGRSEELFEGLTLTLAAGVLTWMIFWMQAQGGRVQAGLEANVLRATTGGQRWGLFSVAFVSVLREGVETGLFLTAAALVSKQAHTLVGALLGLLTAALLGAAVFAATIRLDLRRFFTVTGVVLLVFAAGLISQGIHEFNALGWIPPLVPHVWDLSRYLNPASSGAQMLATLFGYDGSPSLTQLLAYVIYLAGVAALLLRRRRQPSPVQA